MSEFDTLGTPLPNDDPMPRRCFFYSNSCFKKTSVVEEILCTVYSSVQFMQFTYISRYGHSKDIMTLTLLREERNTSYFVSYQEYFWNMNDGVLIKSQFSR